MEFVEFIGTFIAGFIVGVFFGLILTGLVVSGKISDIEAENILLRQELEKCKERQG